MKCKGCGATYDPQMEYCPYCGAENVKLRRQREALARKQLRYEERREEILSESAGQMRLRKVSRLMWITLAISGLSFLILLGMVILQDTMDTGRKGNEAYLQMLKEEKRWSALEGYLYEADVDDERYDEYWQLAYVTEDLEDLREYRDEYLRLDREEYLSAFRKDPSVSSTDAEYCESHFEFLVGRILWDCQQILLLRREYTDADSWKAEIYGPLTPDAEACLVEAETEARATLWLIFGMNEKETEELLACSYLDDAEKRPYIDRVKEEWLHE